MAMSSGRTDQKSPWFYIGHVTLKQAWRDVRTFFYIWLFFVAFSFGFDWLWGQVDWPSYESITHGIPKSVQYVTGWAIVSLIFRGQTFQFGFPETTKQWMLSVVFVCLIVFGGAYASSGTMYAAWFWGLLAIVGLFNQMAKEGKENYEASLPVG